MKSNFLLCLATLVLQLTAQNGEGLFGRRIEFKSLASQPSTVQKLVKNAGERALNTVLNLSTTSDAAMMEIARSEGASSLDAGVYASSPEAQNFDLRTQLVNRTLQFTDDIRLIIANVINMRRNFEEAKEMQALMNMKSLYRGAGYKEYSEDVRLNRPLQPLLQTGDIPAPPRRLLELDFAPQPPLQLNGLFENAVNFGAGRAPEGTVKKSLAKMFMTPAEYSSSGVEQLTQGFHVDGMYELSGDDLSNFNVERKPTEKLNL